mmetsp:Transcript_39806/g.96081  ORF Transcript_39806/g.96081 Transcript_39806/m.96081 type:complete len:105 (+) Transcript_39806:954-1268(+)
MAYVAGEAILGEKPPHWEELSALGRAVALKEGVYEAAEALKAVSNEHAVYDASGIIGFFASITKIVDFTGHYSDTFPSRLERVGAVLNGARYIRSLAWVPGGQE